MIDGAVLQLMEAQEEIIRLQTVYLPSTPTNDGVYDMRCTIQNGIITNVSWQRGHVFSTTEQIIGTWVDGKFLYEVAVTTGGNVPTGATLIDRIAKTGYDIIQYTK